jgi:hypothetical protein
MSNCTCEALDCTAEATTYMDMKISEGTMRFAVCEACKERISKDLEKRMVN